MRHYSTLPSRQRLIPQDRLSEARVPASHHGVWEPVQPSAQRVYQDDYLSRRPCSLSHYFTELGFQDDIDDFYRRERIRKRENLHQKHYNSRSSNLGIIYHSDNSFSRTHSERLGRHTQNNYIQIPVEHVRTIPRTDYRESYKNTDGTFEDKHDYSSNRNHTWRQNSCEIIDLSDEEFSEDSSSGSDCDIYPFTLRNQNNNVKRRKRYSSGEPHIYSLRNSASPDVTDSRRVSNSRNYSSQPSTSHSTSTSSTGHRRRHQDEDLICISDDHDDLLQPKRTRENILSPLDASNKSYNIKDPQERYSSTSRTRLIPGKNCYLIEDDEDSAFSNKGFQLSDDENNVIDYKSTASSSQKDNVDSRRSSDSDGVIVKTPSYPAYNIIHDMIHSEGRQVDYIRGDGNCLFRALSKVIYNTESCHEEIRQAVVDLMEKYPKEFEQFIDERSVHSHIIYMRKDGTWGTQAEIYGAATLLQRDIYILSPDPTGKQYRWLLFSPRFKLEDVDSFDACYITLCHTNGNHYDRIAPLVGRCNCHLLPPELSGVKDSVDLTSDPEVTDLVV